MFNILFYNKTSTMKRGAIIIINLNMYIRQWHTRTSANFVFFLKHFLQTL